MAHDLNRDERARREVLVNSPVIAVVGRSNDHYYTSYDVGEYLMKQGYIVFNVNPNIDDIDGEPVYDSLKNIPEKVDIVDVFRNSDYLEGIVDQAIAIGAKTVWAQLGVENEDARLKALGAGLNYAENLCIRTEHERLFKGMAQG
ncbi:MAG: CoA-binding protein [Anaerolineae bacterium]|nr:CoA-binding protein [Anaerolineae bacterium]